MNLRSSLFITLLCFLSSQAIGKKLYQYKDEKGQWQFTDKQPETEQPVTIKQFDVGSLQRVWLLQSGTSTEPFYYLRNDFAGPVEVEISASLMHNVYALPKLPRHFIADPGNSDGLVYFRQINGSKPWQVKLSFNYVVGTPLNGFQSTYEYQPPFAPNQSFQISQGFNGTFSHTEPYSQYAVDFPMPVGTPIHTARDGIVMAIDNDYYKSGTDSAAIFAKDFSGRPARKISKNHAAAINLKVIYAPEGTKCLRLPQPSCCSRFMPNKGHKTG